MIAASQEAIRTFAGKEIFKGLKRHEDQTATAESDLLVEARSRAKASVSLRDIQRVFSLFQFFTTEFPLSAGNEKRQISNLHAPNNCNCHTIVH